MRAALTTRGWLRRVASNHEASESHQLHHAIVPPHHVRRTGLTFYDDDVTAFFSPHAAGKSVIFLIALGRSAKQNAQRG